jgi:hypothetical protein
VRHAAQPAIATVTLRITTKIAPVNGLQLDGPVALTAALARSGEDG